MTTLTELYIKSECATAIIKSDSRVSIPHQVMNSYGVMTLAITRLLANEATDRYKDENPVDVKSACSLLQRIMNSCGVSVISEAVNKRDLFTILQINQVLFLATLMERKLLKEKHVTELDLDELESFLDAYEAVCAA